MLTRLGEIIVHTLDPMVLIVVVAASVVLLFIGDGKRFLPHASGALAGAIALSALVAALAVPDVAAMTRNVWLLIAILLVICTGIHASHALDLAKGDAP